MFEPPPRPPIADAPLSVILLALGPPADVAEGLIAWHAYLDALCRPYEVLLVRPRHADDEPAPEGAFAFDPAEGYGAALQAAIRAAQHPLVALATADRQFRPDDLQRLLAVIDKADLAVGCRVCGPTPLWRRALDGATGLLARVFVGLPLGPRLGWLGSSGWGRRRLARWVFGVHLHDPESFFRLFRREAVARFPLQAKGPFVLVEMLAKANHLECILTEEPVAWTPPAAPPAEPATFRREAWQVFREPDFGPVEPPAVEPSKSAE